MQVKGAADRDRVCVGAVAGAHGIRGEVRIKPFTEVPEDVAAYGPVADESGTRRFGIAVHEVRGVVVIATLDGVTDRSAAEALKGLRLYVPRTALPAPEEDEFYHSDLLGMAAVLADGTAVGRVRAIVPAGATDVLEIDRGPGTEMLLVPFTKQAVPDIDVGAGRMVIVPAAAAGGETEDDNGDREIADDERNGSKT